MPKDLDVLSELRSQISQVLIALFSRVSRACSTSTKTYFQSFLSLHELARENAPTDRYKIVIHADKRPANEHVRPYNGPLALKLLN